MHNKKLADIIVMSFGAYLLFALAFAQIAFLKHFKRWGDISYGAYLYAWPTQKLLLWYDVSSSPWINFALTFIISFSFGALSWHLIEKRFLRLKSRPARKVMN
jgi:peptidoglycan/LPS O-acetylase OafA/YrhL